MIKYYERYRNIIRKSIGKVSIEDLKEIEGALLIHLGMNFNDNLKG